MLNGVAYVFALLAVVLALATTFMLARLYGVPSKAGRFVSIDGLRGYLSFFVFLQHGAVWESYRVSGGWSVPSSHVFAHMGQSSVLIFFMITSFLFCTKLIDSRASGIDWPKLFVGRVMRLAPLWLCVVCLMFLVVAVLSGGLLRESPSMLMLGTGRWLIFTVLGSPDLNLVNDTWVILAGVVWSLRYEWMFYLSLPLLAALIGKRPPLPFLVLALFGVCGFALKYSDWHYLLAFAGGMVAALAVRIDGFRALAVTRTASLLVIVAVGSMVYAFDSSYSIAPLLTLTLVFTVVAGGNTLFGVLSHGVSRALGELAYGLYLLHGLFLFVVFQMIIGAHASSQLTPPVYWAIVASMTPLLIVTCLLAFRYVEQPGMRQTSQVTNWLRSVRPTLFKVNLP